MVCRSVCVRRLGGVNVVVCIVCGLLCAVLWCVMFVVCAFVLRVVYCVMVCGNGFVVFLCACVVSVCDVFMVYCVLSSGLCWCCCVFVRAGLNVFARVVCDLLCDVV